MVVMMAIMMVVPGHRMRMVGHVVADDRAADAAYDGADWAAYHCARYGACGRAADDALPGSVGSAGRREGQKGAADRQSSFHCLSPAGGPRWLPNKRAGPYRVPRQGGYLLPACPEPVDKPSTGRTVALGRLS